VDDAAVTVEHLFADFENLANGQFETAFNKVLSRGHDAIVTFEPMTRPPEPVDQSVLQNIVRGEYDDEFAAIFRIVSNRQATVYLRFAHEMEIPITRYPWQSQDPVEYIRAFRYFMQFPGKLAPNIVRIWGPAGDRGSIEFWPGDDVVDEVSVAIYGLPDKNITDPKAQESFRDIFERKAYRLRFVDKPIFITEFGVKGPEAFQTRWLEDAARTIVAHPEIQGVNYFNMVDNPEVWGDIKAPDWSITMASLHRFVALVN
jgi:beta-mannanase